MTRKVPLSLNARTNWFQYEQLVREWRDTCAIEPPKQGPLLRSHLYDVAEVYKEFFDSTLLKDPESGVDYFLQFLKPKFIKGASNIFLGRLIHFNQLRRGQLDLPQWLAKYKLHMKRLQDSWMDLLGPPLTDESSNQFRNVVLQLGREGTIQLDGQQGNYQESQSSMVKHLVNQ